MLHTVTCVVGTNFKRHLYFMDICDVIVTLDTAKYKADLGFVSLLPLNAEHGSYCTVAARMSEGESDLSVTYCIPVSDSS